MYLYYDFHNYIYINDFHIFCHTFIHNIRTTNINKDDVYMYSKEKIFITQLQTYFDASAEDDL